MQIIDDVIGGSTKTVQIDFISIKSLGTVCDVITVLICLTQRPNEKNIFQKGKRHYSLLRKAFLN